jgi:hypothetical protein
VNDIVQLLSTAATLLLYSCYCPTLIDAPNPVHVNSRWAVSVAAPVTPSVGSSITPSKQPFLLFACLSAVCVSIRSIVQSF